MDAGRRPFSLHRNGYQDLIKRQNKSWGQKRRENLKSKYLKKKRGQNWGQNPIFLFQSNSQSSQKHKKGLT